MISPYVEPFRVAGRRAVALYVLTSFFQGCRHTGTAVAVFAFWLFIGGGLGTWLAGQAIDTQGYGATLAGTAAACVAFAGLGTWLLPKVQGGLVR